MRIKTKFESLLLSDPKIRQSDLVSASVTDGTANLGGAVGTWKEHTEATHLAFKAGARIVVNHIAVRDDLARSSKRYVYHRDPTLTPPG